MLVVAIEHGVDLSSQRIQAKCFLEDGGIRIQKLGDLRCDPGSRA
jgi:hypothetical protein